MSFCKNYLFDFTQSQKEVSLLYRIYNNVLECLQIRGYPINNYEKTFEDFVSLFKNEDEPDVSILKIVTSKEETEEKKEEDKIIVMFSDEEKLGVKQIKKFIDQMDTTDSSRCILVLKYPLSMYAKKTIEEFNTMFSLKYVEYFDYTEFLMNITKHTLVPDHIILNKSEIKELIQNYSLKRETQLPKLLHMDPMSKYLGLRKGQVVKVVRNSETTTKYLTYRIVV